MHCRAILGLAVALAALSPREAPAEKLSAADKAWIETCVAQRTERQRDTVALGKYCSCMQQIVEDNTPFGITELERSYPPAHLMCRKAAGMR